MRITEENFITLLIQKNEKALDFVIDNYGWVIQSVVKKQLGNLEGYTEECVNDVLLEIWNNAKYFDPSRSTFKNWIGVIAKFKAIDYQRKYIKHLENQTSQELLQTLVQGCEMVDASLLQDELRREIDKMLVHLNEQDRHLFLEAYENEKRIKDISTETGIKESVIYNRLSRAKKKLKVIFGRR
ncbi:MAG: RNA polymerase subunit sigma-70 [Epulopiscium sp. Nele67-Bin005]|nr:MAG: RNA polymerase subunit sigma-70 [Epulopiscium sp. Nele67-Bin005]